MTVAPNLLRILFRGLVIDAQAADSRVVHLVVRTHKQHGSAYRRLLQHLANAVYRLGDLLNPSDHNGLPRVVERVVVPQAGDDRHADDAHLHIINRLPVHLPDGDTSYEWLVPYEGVEHKELGLLGPIGAGFGEDLSDMVRRGSDGLNKCADGLHVAFSAGGVMVVPDAIDSNQHAPVASNGD